MILCDIGNSSFHFYINKESKKYFEDDILPKLDEPIYFISVNKIGTKKLKKRYKECIDIGELVNFKTRYKGLGIDRAVACSFIEDGVVVDAGSAITVDIIKNGKHKGGFILPGIKSYEKIYPKISKKLKFNFEKKVNLDKIPLQTKDAINYAILKSIILPIKKVSKKKKIIFTGGDGKILSKYFDNSIYKEYLIFEAMEGIINANNCITKG